MYIPGSERHRSHFLDVPLKVHEQIIERKGKTSQTFEIL